MQRRDVLAGIGSAGVLAGAGAVAVYGVPSPETLLEEDGERHDPLAVETVEARGSEAGEVLIPAQDQPTFIDLFGTWCPPCVEQMPELAIANERIGDQVLFISVTSEGVGENRSITEDELVDWWAEHDGNWLLGLDHNAEVTERYLDGGFPTAAVIDASGRIQWSDNGVHSADEIVATIEGETDAEETS
ncbi:alkyl hydroperoxide reductase/ thiol specific antioxidant/ Mal allergen [Natrialba hulunbeirensis JCM 10989]|uniref:Alkyl hydroperoxide reductase/ thiol specific antioxidant/ Mal allergen n=1 Tax=Natrialba hulunbeirensis JCM 10989 TaxID=1227493 RepID=L9ZLZ8_9EURY|nr:TlpA disulfide reductase family protein [Natrialba hulunbeirensis]ELY87520.1 alkyl hydroperoxide reductase/ thiol specific antioxidant/ Mal allergen [Natrialba hulunbeirensis JCM 10989]